MQENKKGILPLFVSVLSVLGLAFLSALPGLAQQTAVGVQVLTNAVVNDPVAFDVSPTLLEMVQEPVPSAVTVTRPVLRPKLQQLMAAPQGVSHGLPISPGPTIG